MVNENIILIRVSKLKEYLNTLKEISKYDVEEYIKTPMIYRARDFCIYL